MSTTDTSSTDWNAHFASRAETTLAAIADLVRIESPSRDGERVGRVARRVAAALADAGGRVETIDEHPNGPNVVARFGRGDRAPVMLVGHLDTVWAAGTLASMPWRVENGLAYGPGVFDMKAGVVVAIEALDALAGAGSAPDVTVVFNCDEEVGSESSRPIVEREARRARAVLVLEPCIPGGMAKTSRSGMADYRVRVTGRAAHAGVDPEKGASAILAMADIVTRLHALNDLPAGLSVNVGTLGGGTRANVVAAEAVAEVDVRFRRAADAERVDAAIRGLTASVPGTRAEIDGGVDRPPFEPSEATMRLYARAAAAARRAGFEMGHGHVGGVSDGNFTAAIGVPTLDGLGVDGMGAHAAHEQIVVADVPRRAAMLAYLLADLAAE